MKKALLMLLTTCLGVFSLTAQEKLTVSGRVTDAQTGEPLMAVGVLQQGTSNGVISAMDGDYAITVPKGTVLEFSSIGYETIQVVADRELIDIALKVDANLLDEVVVVGYGVQKKSSLTGSVSSVKTADLKSRGVTNVNQALAGKASGIQSFSTSARPGAEPNIQVRGIGSNGSSSPLYVIDGRIASGTGALSPNDIESIEVLKDGASAAIYGASAGNGVILITTKKGKGDSHVSYDFQIASQSIAYKPHMMNSEQFIDYWVDAGALTLTNVYNHWDGMQNTDWFDASFEPSIMQKHNVSFSGGNNGLSYYLSGSYTNNNGMVKGNHDTYNAYNGVINVSYKVKKWLELGTSNIIEYTRQNTVGEGSYVSNLFLDAMGMAPIVAPYYSYENLWPELVPFANSGMLHGDENGYYGMPSFYYTNKTNPLALRDQTTNELRGFSFSGTTFLNVTPLDGLTFTSRLSYSLSASESYSASHAKFENPSQYSSSLGVTSINSDNTYWQWENFASYAKSFGNHSITAMIGQSFSENRAYSTSAGVSGSQENPGFAYDDPNFLYIAYADPSVTKSVGGGEPSYARKIAYFGRLNYAFRDKYLLQASLRADAADLSILPVAHRWGCFPAASAGWVVSKENFMSGTRKWLDLFKVRVSWGQNGSLASLGGYQYSKVIGKTGSYSFDETTNYVNAYATSVTGNEQLKWETSEQLDAGLDLSMFGNKLTLSADWYRKETEDLIVSGVKKTNTSGFSPSPINAGSMLNKGVELELGWRDQIGDFQYGIRGNFTTLTNKVTAVHENMNRIPGATLINGTTFTMFEKGMPSWYFYGYKYLGVDPTTGDPLFDTGEDGMLNSDDMQYIGKGIPDLTYGITLNFAYKGIDFIVFGSGVSGVDIFNVYDLSPEYVYNRLSIHNEDRWTTSNTTGTRPRVGGAYTSQLMTSSYNVYDGSFFKIKQMQLGYTLPKRVLDRLKIENLRIYASLEDFYTFTDYVGFDPEVTGFGSSMGVDFGYYPNSRKAIFGLNITF